MVMNHAFITRFWFLIGLFFLLLQWILIAWSWNDLGETIPNHFDSDGNPDGWGSKYSLYLITLVSIAMFLFLHWLARNTQQFNGLAKITPENKAHQEPLDRQFIMSLNAGLTFLFLYMLYAMIEAAKNGASNNTTNVLGILLIAIGLPTLLYLIQSRRINA